VKQSELKIPAGLLEALPGEVRDRIPRAFAAALEERSRAAVEWRWAAYPTGDEDFSPMRVERDGYRPGRRRKPPVPHGRELSVYGYDGEGRALVATDRDGTGGNNQHRLCWHGEAESIAFLVRAASRLWPPELIAVWRSRNEAGRPVLIEHLGEYGGSVEGVRWEGERPVEVRVEYRGRERAQAYRDVLVWEGATLVRVERHWEDGPVEIKFERPPKGVTPEALLRELEDELVERIPAAAAGIGRGEPISALALGYCDGERSLPPQLVACPKPVRERLVDGSDDDFWYRWHAAEWMSAADVPELTAYGGADFNARCEHVDRQIRLSGDERAAGRLLRAVARRLNALDWSDLLDVTPDFVVYPWEVHGESLEEDLAASEPAAGPPTK
jgi:hypothetical protein